LNISFSDFICFGRSGKITTNLFDLLFFLAAIIPLTLAKSTFDPMNIFSFQNKRTVAAPVAPTKHTLQPIVTGTTVLGIKYNGGVMMAADTLGSYGSLARYKEVQRVQQVGNFTLIGASGEISDYQSILESLQTMHQSDVNQDDGYTRLPSEFFHYLRSMLYQRRNKGNPYWNQILVGGFENGKSFLGYVDLIGTAYEENFIATGFGAYLAMPLIRERWTPEMDESEARSLLEDCLRVLYYRDCRASNRIQIAKATEAGTLISPPYQISSDWETANYDVRHASKAVLDGSSW
jgi:20S proteasome subunit beta 7